MSAHIDSASWNQELHNIQLAFTASLVDRRFLVAASLLRILGVETFNNPAYDAVRIALALGSVETLIFLRAQGCSFAVLSTNGKYPIFSALHDVDCLRYLLLCSEVNVNCRYEGQPLLLHALLTNCKEASIRALLEKPEIDVDCTYLCPVQRPVLYVLAYSVGVLQLLILRLKRLSVSLGSQLLLQAVMQCKRQHLRTLANSGYQLNTFSLDRQSLYTAILQVPSTKRLRMIRFLRESNYDLQKADQRGHNLLSYAQQAGEHEIIAALGEQRTVPDSSPTKKWTEAYANRSRRTVSTMV